MTIEEKARAMANKLIQAWITSYPASSEEERQNAFNDIYARCLARIRQHEQQRAVIKSRPKIALFPFAPLVRIIAEQHDPSSN